MECTIQQMESILVIDEKPLIGFAFIDKWNHCIIIVYGERKKELIEDLLNNIVS